MNIEALFLGPKAENRQWFKKMVKELLEEHIHWRRNFHPEDKASITNEDQRKPDYLNTLQKTENVLFELSGMLKARALPAHSPRYAGHMLTDLLMPAHLAYLATVLYNPNNVCWEAAPVTTALEVEVGIAIGVMLGFDKSKCYGHITSGGTVANLECLWVARNVRSMPFALKHVYPDRLGHATEKELQNMTLDEILDFVEKDPSKIEEVKAFSVRGVGIRSGNLNFGKVFVPRTKHYSWNKAMDVLGMGQNNLVYVDVDIKFRLDINDLSKKVLQAVHDGHPILAVVGVVGSTEEGAVDPINEIIALRKRVYKEHKVWFWVHVDGAYGGYASSIFRDVDHSLLPRDRLVEKLHDLKIIDKKLGWPEKEVYNAFAAIGKADSVTIDPHKLGYVPYQAGAMVVRDKRVQPLLSYFATYIFEVTGPEDSGSGIPLGSYILEGSKAGATAAAVWAAHQVVPGNIEGYGRIIGESFEGCNLLYHKLQNFRWESNETPKRSFVILTMNKPDTNLLIYVVNQEGNRSLKKLNAITQQIRDATSPKGLRGTFTYNFMLSSTSLTHEEYGECPKAILERLGLDVAEWDQLHTVSVLRSTLMSPYTTTDFTEVDYGDVVLDGLKKVLTYLVETNRI